MKIPLSYVARNLWVRKLTTALTAGGMALVVFVFAAVLMLDAGLKTTLVSTGSADNVVVIRQGSQTEVQSGILRDQAALIETAPEVARGPDGRALVSKEVVVLNSLPKIDQPTKRSNVVVRGVPEMGIVLRPQVTIVQGRMFRAGSSEIVVGGSVARGFAGVELGQQLSFAGRGVDRRRRVRRRQDRLRLRNLGRRRPDDAGVSPRGLFVRDRAPCDAGFVRSDEARLDEDPRLKVDIKRETKFYEDQSAGLSTFITLLGMALSVIFSLGAMIGAAITMYAAVATRTGEIGTLRALGFRRARDSRRVPRRIAAARAGRRPRRARLRPVPDRAHGVDHELPVVLGTRVLVHADPAHRRAVPRVRPADGLRRRVPAGHQGEPDEDRRRAAGGLTRRVPGLARTRYRRHGCRRGARPGMLSRPSGTEQTKETSMKRREFSIAVAATLAAAPFGLLSPAFAQQVGTLKMMIPANPGGGWDQTGRQLAAAMQSAKLVQSVSFENKGGAAGTPGLAQFVNSAKGDPNAVMIGGLVMVGGIILNKSPVDLTMVTPIARLTSEYEVIVVPASSPHKTMGDLVKAFKANPGSISWGGGSAGGTDHILVGMIAKAVGGDVSKINYVPFKGGGDSIAAIVGGHVTAGVSGLGRVLGADQVRAHARARRVRSERGGRHQVAEGAGHRRRARQLARESSARLASRRRSATNWSSSCRPRRKRRRGRKR